jgi:hypothetical protein
MLIHGDFLNHNGDVMGLDLLIKHVWLGTTLKDGGL